MGVIDLVFRTFPPGNIKLEIVLQTRAYPRETKLTFFKMTRLSKSSEDVRKGAWAAEEDEKLRKYVETYGTGHWRSVGKKAGLQRCGKSCRLRWTNYLRPDIRHGSFTVEEEDLIVKLHAAHGSRWSLIAAQMSGRTDNDIKNHWNTRLKKKLCDMGIDPVTHKPIADLLRDLAGTMAQSSGGNQVAEEAARRCFRDTLVSKAVRECSKNNPALVSQFMNQSLSMLHHQDQLQRTDGASGLPELQSIADRVQKSSNNSGSHSMDESSSTEEALSRRSNSPPAAALENSNHHRYHQPASSDHQNVDTMIHPRLPGTVVESTCGRIAYLSSAQMNEATMARFAEGASPLAAFPEEQPGCNSSAPLHLLPAASGSGSEYYFRNSSDFEKACKEYRPSSPILSRPRQLNLSPALAVIQPRPDYTRWLQASRSSLPQDHQEFHNSQTSTLPMSRFSSEMQNQLNQTSHAAEVSYIQGVGADASSSRSLASAGASKFDIRINLGFNQPGSLQESFGYRSFNGPLTTSPMPTGATGSILDITTQHTLSGYAGQYSTSIGPNNVGLSTFNTALAGTPTGMRLHEYEVPSPRMVLWDFQE